MVLHSEGEADPSVGPMVWFCRGCAVIPCLDERGWRQALVVCHGTTISCCVRLAVLLCAVIPSQITRSFGYPPPPFRQMSIDGIPSSLLVRLNIASRKDWTATRFERTTALHSGLKVHAVQRSPAVASRWCTSDSKECVETLVDSSAMVVVWIHCWQQVAVPHVGFSEVPHEG